MLPGTRALTLAEEAQMLLRYTVVQLAQYLREVECNPARGPAQAHALRGAVHEALRGSAHSPHETA